MDLLKFEIVTPAGTVHSEEVHMVTFPAVQGHIGVLPRHDPLMTQLVPGEMIIHAPTADRYVVVGEGLAEVAGDHVTILTDMAIPVEHIDEARVEEARQRAEARLREKLSEEEMALVRASLARSLAQLEVKRRHRS